MKKAFKWGLIIGGGLVVLFIATLLILPMFIDVKKYKPLLEDKVAEATGRPFTVGEDVGLSLFPWAAVSFSDIRLGNTDAFVEKDFVSLKSFEVRLKLLPLLFRDIQVKKIILNEPRILMVKNKNGRGNWEQPQKPGGKKAAGKEKKPGGEKDNGKGLPLKTLEIGEFSIKNGFINWTDHDTGTQKTISDLNLTLKDFSLEHPVQVQFSVKVDGRQISLNGNVGPIGKDFKEGTIPLDFTVKALSQINMKLKGRVEKPTGETGVNLNVTLTEFSPRKLLSELGQIQAITTTDPQALNRAALQAKITADSKQVSIAEGILSLDDSKLNFNFNIANFSNPVIKSELELDRIDMDRYLPPKSEKKEGPVQKQKAASVKKKTDYEPLRNLNLDAQLKAGTVIVNKAKLNDIYLKISAKNGEIRIKPFGLSLYQGNISGSGILNVEKDSPRTRVDVDVSQVQIGPLLRDQLDKDLLEGITKARLKLSFSGDTPEIIKKTLNGEGEIKLSDGAVKGVDLAGMVRNIKAAFGHTVEDGKRPRTDFTELLSPFRLQNGVYNTPGTSLMSPLLRVKAVGNADLVKETLQFRVEPKVVGTIKGQGDTKKRNGIMVPVIVTGSFSSPEFKPDLKAAAKQQVEERVFESKKAKKLFEKEELKPYEDTAKSLLKGLLD